MIRERVIRLVGKFEGLRKGTVKVERRGKKSRGTLELVELRETPRGDEETKGSRARRGKGFQMTYRNPFSSVRESGPINRVLSVH